MPRLTNSDYLADRAFLQDAWTNFPSAFTYLTYNEQSLLHRFFAFRSDYSDEEALQHRNHVSTPGSSLPNQAGKALRKFVRISRALAQNRVPKPIEQPTRVRVRVPTASLNIRVRAIARPEVDVEVLAKALLDYVDSEENRKHDGGAGA